MPPKMNVDFFHFLEEVDPLCEEMEASSSAKIGFWEMFSMIFGDVVVVSGLKYSKILNEKCKPATGYVPIP